MFELKYDGFPALAYVGDGCSLVSRRAHVFKQFDPLRASIAATLRIPAVLDGEIMILEGQGRPQFKDLLFPSRRSDLRGGVRHAVA